MVWIKQGLCDWTLERRFQIDFWSMRPLASIEANPTIQFKNKVNTENKPRQIREDRGHCSIEDKRQTEVVMVIVYK